MTHENSSAAIYTMGLSTSETQRLITQASLYEPITERMLDSAGIATGMRVLDVGTGAGDVALLAAARVGPTGSVTAIDMNPRILATARLRASAAGLTNVTFVEADCRTLMLDGRFDAAIGRLVLLYAPEPAAAILRVAAAVRPGGVVAFQEPDLAPLFGYTTASSTPVAHQVYTWFSDAFRCTGANPFVGSALYAAFLEAGLGEPHLDLYAAMGGGADWGGYRLAADTLNSMLPILERFGVATAEEVDVGGIAERLHLEVVQTGRPFMLAPFVVAWARKPA